MLTLSSRCWVRVIDPAGTMLPTRAGGMPTRRSESPTALRPEPLGRGYGGEVNPSPGWLFGDWSWFGGVGGSRTASTRQRPKASADFRKIEVWRPNCLKTRSKDAVAGVQIIILTILLKFSNFDINREARN